MANQIDIPTEQLIQDYLRGLTINDIHKKYGISKYTVKRKIENFLSLLNSVDKELLQSFKEHKSEVLDALQLKLVQEMFNEYKIKRAPLRDLAGAFEKIYNSTRLERNLSTENISMKQESFVNIVQDIIKDKNIEQI